MDLIIQKIIREISEKFDVDESIVKDASVSQFKFVKEVMRTNKDTEEDKPILLNHLCKFKVKKGRRKFLNSVNKQQQLSTE